MLVLSRKNNESICIGDNITVKVIAINGNRVRLGIDAPKSVPVMRQEVEVEISEQGAPFGGGSILSLAMSPAE